MELGDPPEKKYFGVFGLSRWGEHGASWLGRRMGRMGRRWALPTTWRLQLGNKLQVKRLWTGVYLKKKEEY